MLCNYNLHLYNDPNQILITNNKMIMQYAIEYLKQKELNNKTIDHINYMWLYKKMILPIELVSTSGNGQTDAFWDIEAESLIE